MKKKYHVKLFIDPEHKLVDYGVCYREGGKLMIEKDDQGNELLYPTRAKALACRDYLNKKTK